MKLTTFNTDDVITSQEFDTGEFGITANGLIVVASILRDKLYNDKIMAPIREYCSNAWDAHVMVGKKNVPIQITVPNQLNPVFKVRDFGPGLSEQEVADLYTKYGESTKRNTNRAIGSFGIGCKSGFCVSDSFLVISFYNGTKNTYNCYLDEKGVGKYALMSSENTTEKNGIEIQIPVNPNKIWEWHNKIKNFCIYCTPKPEIFGVDPANILVPEITDFWFKDATWQLNKTNTYGSKLIMGIVAYDISYEKLGVVNDKYKTLLNNFSVTIQANIGAVDPAANRESLEYTEKTINYIIRKLDDIIVKIKEKCEEKIKNINNLWEAKILYTELYESSLSGAEKQLFAAVFGYNSFEWNGHKISSNLFRFNTYGDGITIIRYIRSTWGNRLIDAQNCDQIRADKETLIFNVNFNTTSQQDLYSRIGDLVYNQDKTVYLIEFRNSKSTYDDLSKKYNLDQLPIKLLSSLPVKKDWRPKNAIVRTARSAAVLAKTLRLKQNAKDIYEIGDQWEPATIDLANGTGYYLPIDRFVCTIEGETFSGKQFIELKNAAVKYLGLDISTEIYGFKKSIMEANKIGPGWINFLDYIVDGFVQKFKKDNFAEIIHQYNSINKTIDYREQSLYNNLYAFLQRIITDPTHLISQYTSRLDKINKDYSSLKINEINNLLSAFHLFQKVNAKNTSNFGPFTLRTDFIKYVCETYPMAAHVLSTYSSNITGEIQSDIKKYIELVDKQKAIDNQQNTV